MFTTPHFDAFEVVYSAIGAMALYAKLGREKRRIYLLSGVIDMTAWTPFRRSCVEVVLFVSVGAFVSIGITDPTTPTQAIAAGMSWTGLLSAAPKGP